jgi:hypothetical protein
MNFFEVRRKDAGCRLLCNQSRRGEVERSRSSGPEFAITAENNSLSRGRAGFEKASGQGLVVHIQDKITASTVKTAAIRKKSILH